MFFKKIILNKIKNKLKKTRKKFQDKIEIEQNKQEQREFVMEVL